jgi:hypothetical protein
MMRFAPVAKPEGFAEAERLGAQWLVEHPAAERPYPYWSPFRSDLAEGFGQLCAYCAMYEPVGTIDHFVSWDEDRAKAYAWDNYRFASQWINSSKQKLRSHEILDPFEVDDAWFELLLPSLQLVASAAVPEALRDRVETMLKRLHLRDDERVLRQRREWYRMYQHGELTLEGLRKKAPLIARAIDDQQRKRPPPAEASAR